MFSCGIRLIVGILSTITSVLTGGVLFGVCLTGAIVFKGDIDTDGTKSNGIQTLCIILSIIGMIILVVMLVASWTQRKVFRIIQIIVCCIFFLIYIAVIGFLAKTDALLNLLGKLWEDNAIKGAKMTLENSFECCGYGSTEDRCGLILYDCRDAMRHSMELNKNIVIVFIVMFMLYVSATGVLFVILLKFEENDKIEDKSDSELDDFGMFDKGEYTGIFDNMNQMMNPGTISAIPSNTTVIQDSPLVPDMIFDITSEQEINVINESDDDEIKIENDQKINVQNENNKKENDNKEVQSIVNLTNDRENPPHMMGMLCLAEISTSDDD